MTDDKGAGEGPYRKITHYTKFETGDSRIDAYGDGVAELDVTNSDGWGILRLINSAHFEGRKAERERCAKIAEVEAGEIPECVTGRIIATKIRGGQDGK